jgi:hypothetical protein
MTGHSPRREDLHFRVAIRTTDCVMPNPSGPERRLEIGFAKPNADHQIGPARGRSFKEL